MTENTKNQSPKVLEGAKTNKTMKNAGLTFPIALDKEILKINSPKSRVKGPWIVIHKDVTNRWAIVLMKWGTEFCLGIRWFTRTQGTPSVGGNATWLVLPNQLADAILDKLPLKPIVRHKVDEVLKGKYTDKQLDTEGIKFFQA